MVGHRKVIDNYYCDVNNLAELLTKYVNSYRLLIGGAGEINQITLARKKEVRDALKRADKLGHIIDELLDVIELADCVYMNYCDLKSQCIDAKIEINVIQTEIDDDLDFKNDNKK